MEKVTIYFCLVLAGIIASSASQILLKKSADDSSKSFIPSMLNWRVIIAYCIFFSSLFINITAMSNGVNLKDIPILESLGYVFVPLFSYIFLKEAITQRVIVSVFLISVGIFIFYL